MVRLAALILLTGCATKTIDLGDTADTAQPAEDDTGPAPDDSGAGDTGAPPDDTGEPPPPEPDYSRFEGEERFSYDNYGLTCDEAYASSGELIGEGSATFGALAAACPTCSSFYEVTFDGDEACGWIPLVTSWYGLTLGADTAETHLLIDNGDGTVTDLGVDAEGSFDGWTATHTWSVDFAYGYFPVEITGAIVFPAADGR